MNMFNNDNLMFIKRIMTIKVIKEVEEYKQINIDQERALQVIEAIDPHSDLRERMIKKIREAEQAE